MHVVIFATCEQQPQIAPDDQPLAAALRARGIHVDPAPWTQIDPFAIVDAPPILLRSTWDYHRMPTMFRVWLQGLEASHRQTWNGPAAARANVDKVYLRELAAHGLAVPPTRWLDHVDPSVIRRELIDAGWPRAVLKPRIAATAYGTFLLDRDTALTDEDLAPARASGAMLQMLIPEVQVEGELSLVYVDGRFSHAVLKHAADGDFRVQQDFGGRVTPCAPTPEQLAFADRVVAAGATDCLYARVDLVQTPDGPLLMELELIEPELFLQHSLDGTARLADAIASRIFP